MAELQVQGASLDEPLTLVEAALKVVGGRDCSHWYESPALGDGRWHRRRQRVYVFLVLVES
ncbi:MAG: hypothetical protein ABW135_16425 [Thermoleophilaceae bacterium]